MWLRSQKDEVFCRLDLFFIASKLLNKHYKIVLIAFAEKEVTAARNAWLLIFIIFFTCIRGWCGRCWPTNRYNSVISNCMPIYSLCTCVITPLGVLLSLIIPGLESSSSVLEVFLKLYLQWIIDSKDIIFTSW